MLRAAYFVAVTRILVRYEAFSKRGTKGKIVEAHPKKAESYDATHEIPLVGGGRSIRNGSVDQRINLFVGVAIVDDALIARHRNKIFLLEVKIKVPRWILCTLRNLLLLLIFVWIVEY